MQNLKLKRIHPGLSMRLEKYFTGKQEMLKSFYIGLKTK
jgi:uncharacterized protein involved in tellurium resistance